MKITGQGYYYAILCDSGVKKHDYLICGVYATRKEAMEANEAIKECPAKHLIKKGKIVFHSN